MLSPLSRKAWRGHSLGDDSLPNGGVSRGEGWAALHMSSRRETEASVQFFGMGASRRRVVPAWKVNQPSRHFGSIPDGRVGYVSQTVQGTPAESTNSRYAIG